MGNNSNDDESSDISKWETIIWLSVMTAWISILSEYLVGAMEVGDDIHIFLFHLFSFMKSEVAVICLRFIYLFFFTTMYLATDTHTHTHSHIYHNAYPFKLCC